MSTHTLAAVMVAPHQPIEIRALARPELSPGSALLRTARSEVCDAIGARTYPLTGLNEALADAEKMVMTKALVDPWAGV